jgi:hypothetical protein
MKRKKAEKLIPKRRITIRVPRETYTELKRNGLHPAPFLRVALYKVRQSGLPIKDIEITLDNSTEVEVLLSERDYKTLKNMSKKRGKEISKFAGILVFSFLKCVCGNRE